MADDPRIKTRLNKALALFVSVPLTAMPVMAQQTVPGRTTVRARAYGVHAIQGRLGTTKAPSGLRDNNIGIRVPERVGARLPSFGPTKGQ